MTTLKTAVKKARWLDYLASYADVLLAFQAVLPNERLLKPALKNVDQSRHTSRSGRSETPKKIRKGLIAFRKRRNSSVNSHSFFLKATLTISLKKLPLKLNLLNGSRLYYKTTKCERNSAFCSVTRYHPAVASRKEHVYKPMASSPALTITERNMPKTSLPTLLSL